MYNILYVWYKKSKQNGTFLRSLIDAGTEKKQINFKTPNESSEMNYLLNYSHSVVPGGLFVISYITLETPFTLSISETIF